MNKEVFDAAVNQTIFNVIRIIEEEPEYPEPCPLLKNLIHLAVEDKNEDDLLYYFRMAVRQTKNNIIENIREQL